MSLQEQVYRVVYEILNIKSGKRYVGSAEKYWNRKRCHINDLRNNRHHNNYLQNVYNKYGESLFQFNILEEVCEDCNIIEREQFWIDYYKSYQRNKGYNICRYAYSNKGLKFSNEAKRKMSLAKKGKLLSEQHKKNMIASRTNNPKMSGRIGKLSSISKPISQYSIDGNFIANWESINQCAIHQKLHKSSIIMCLKGRIKQTKGFTFKYVEP